MNQDVFLEYDTVYIGGGWEAPKKFEYYNLTKDKWISLNDTNKPHKTWPMIWNDKPNIINIASIKDCKLFEKIDIRENKWNINRDLTNDTKCIDKLFGINIDIDNIHHRLLYPL